MKKRPLLQRLKAKKDARAVLVGVTWYASERAWSEMKRTALDPELFESTFLEWQSMANEAFVEIKRSGVNVKKCEVVPEDFLAWCLVKGKENDAASRVGADRKLTHF